MKRQKGKCEMCDQWRVMTRYGICDKCYEAQDHSYKVLPKINWRKQWSSSHSLADLQKAKSEETFGLYSGRMEQGNDIE
jgi:hypothetical protein